MDTDNRDQVVALLRAMQANPGEIIGPETRLREDLQMDGDDATDFFEALADQFVVDLSTLDLCRFFNDEGHVIWSPAGMLGRLLGYHREPKGSITVAHLISVVNSGQWSDPGEARLAD